MDNVLFAHILLVLVFNAFIQARPICHIPTKVTLRTYIYIYKYINYNFQIQHDWIFIKKQNLHQIIIKKLCNFYSSEKRKKLRANLIATRILAEYNLFLIQT